MPIDTSIQTPAPKPRSHFSSDTWAVALSLALALLIRLGLIRSVPW